MSTFQQLMPSDGQVFVDSYYVSWQWNIEDQLWHRLGNLNGIPVADENTTGLLPADLKAALDSVAYADGGFGIILSKPAATVFGDIVLRSESFDIQPVDAFGNVIETSLFTASDDTLHSPGFRLSVSEEYLRSFCVEFVAPTGPDGPEGEVGDKGEDGFNDSPKGHLGLTGFDAEGFKTFSGVKIVDVDDLVPRAVVDFQLDTVDNVLVATKSSMNVAGSDVPADQLAAIPISRQLRFALGEGDCKSTLDDWTIVAPTGDPLSDDPDVYLLGVPDSVEIGDVVAPQFAKLSDLINGVTSVYKQKLMNCDNQWLKEARDFISSKDGLARDSLSNLAQKLAECEFEKPLEFSLGIVPPVPSVLPSPEPPTDLFGCIKAGGSVDIVFCLDKTGSMGSVIQSLKDGILYMAEKIREVVPSSRFGIVAYEDPLNESVPLTSDISAVFSFLEELTAGGGGDIPEGVPEALRTATSMDFVASCRRIVVLIGDAPAHSIETTVAEDQLDIDDALEIATNFCSSGGMISTVFTDTYGDRSSGDRWRGPVRDHFGRIATAGCGNFYETTDFEQLIEDLLEIIFATD